MPDPLDLARCRELASELVADARSGHLGILYSHGEGAIANTATALRAACDGVERLRERIAGAEAGIIGKVTARMGWIDMTTAEELIVYLEEQRAIRREASHVTKCERPPLMLDAGEDLDLQPTCCGEYGVKRMAYCGGCPLDEALAAYVGNPAQRRIVLDRFTTLRAHLAAARGEAVEEAARVCAPAMTRLKVLVRALDRGGESAWAAEAHAIYCELSNALTTPPGAGPKQTPPPEGAR